MYKRCNNPTKSDGNAAGPAAIIDDSLDLAFLYSRARKLDTKCVVSRMFFLGFMFFWGSGLGLREQNVVQDCFVVLPGYDSMLHLPSTFRGLEVSNPTSRRILESLCGFFVQTGHNELCMECTTSIMNPCLAIQYSISYENTTPLIVLSLNHSIVPTMVTIPQHCADTQIFV